MVRHIIQNFHCHNLNNWWDWGQRQYGDERVTSMGYYISQYHEQVAQRQPIKEGICWHRADGAKQIQGYQHCSHFNTVLGWVDQSEMTNTLPLLVAQAHKQRVACIRKTPHLLFHLFQCFSMLFSEKAEKAKKSSPLYFFCTCQTAKRKYKKSRLPNVQKWTKEMSKNE